MRRSLAASLAAFVCLPFALPSTASADPPPAPGLVTIEGLSYRGQGCPAGSVATTLSSDNQSVSFLFSQFTVEGGTQTQRRQSPAVIGCEITLKLLMPDGYQFSLKDVFHRGYANLDARTKGWHKSAFRWEDSPIGRFLPLATVKLDGPFNDDWIGVATLTADALTWSPCTGPRQQVELRSRVGVEGRSGVMTVDSVDAQVEQRYGITWRQCTDPGAGLPIKDLETRVDVQANTTLCVDYRRGSMTVTPPASAPQVPLVFTHALTGWKRNRTVLRTARPRQPSDHILPGDWNAVAGVAPVATVRPTNRRVPSRVVVLPPNSAGPNTQCLSVLDGAGSLSVDWNLSHSFPADE